MTVDQLLQSELVVTKDDIPDDDAIIHTLDKLVRDKYGNTMEEEEEESSSCDDYNNSTFGEERKNFSKFVNVLFPMEPKRPAKNASKQYEEAMKKNMMDMIDFYHDDLNDLQKCLPISIPTRTISEQPQYPPPPQEKCIVLFSNSMFRLSRHGVDHRQLPEPHVQALLLSFSS